MNKIQLALLDQINETVQNILNITDNVVIFKLTTNLECVEL